MLTEAKVLIEEWRMEYNQVRLACHRAEWRVKKETAAAERENLQQSLFDFQSHSS